MLGVADAPDEAGLTLYFDALSATFFGGCNTISGSAEFSPHNFRFENVGTTKKVCDAETMNREAALLDAISKMDLFVMEPGDNLAFYDDLNQLLFSARRIKNRRAVRVSWTKPLPAYVVEFPYGIKLKKINCHVVRRIT